jgi:hypothetical protein
VAWSLLDSTSAAFADGSGGHAVSWPSGAPASGNLLVLAVASDTTVSTPVGWTLATSDVQQEGAYLWYRLAGGSEASSVTITTNGDHNAAAALLRYSGSAASSPLDVTDKAAATNALASATPTLTGATLAGSGELCVLAACLHGDDTGAATGATPSAGYTALVTSGMSGSGTAAAQVIVAGRTDGSGSQAPSMSWTKQFKDRTALFGAWLPTGGGASVDAVAALTTTATHTATAAVTRPAGAAPAAAATITATASADRAAAAVLAVTAAITATAGEPVTPGVLTATTRRTGGPT